MFYVGGKTSIYYALSVKMLPGKSVGKTEDHLSLGQLTTAAVATKNVFE